MLCTYINTIYLYEFVWSEEATAGDRAIKKNRAEGIWRRGEGEEERVKS